MLHLAGDFGMDLPCFSYKLLNNHSLKRHNMLTCFHKFMNIDQYPNNDEDDNNYIVSIGIRDEDIEKLCNLYQR